MMAWVFLGIFSKYDILAHITLAQPKCVAFRRSFGQTEATKLSVICQFYYQNKTRIQRHLTSFILRNPGC